jgi:hypothetical protein
MTIPVVLEGRTYILGAEVLETLDVDLVLGMDVLSQMKTGINAVDMSWSY